MKGVQEKDSIMGVMDRQINSSLEIAVWHHSASLMMPDNDPWDGFFYTPMKGPYNPTCLSCPHSVRTRKKFQVY